MIVLTMGYKQYVFSREDGMRVAEALEKAEIYESKYWNKEERKQAGMPEGQDRTHHVYPNTDTFEMRLMSDEMHRLAKLAGRPE
jgi:hypothetical protein